MESERVEPTNDGNVEKKPRDTLCYREECSISYPVITRSSLRLYIAYCNVCKAEFSVSHIGLTDVKLHIATEKHLCNAKEQKSTRKMPEFFHC